MNRIPHKLFFLFIFLSFAIIDGNAGIPERYRSFHARPFESTYKSNQKVNFDIRYYFNYLQDSTSSILPIILESDDANLKIEPSKILLEFNQSDVKKSDIIVHQHEIIIPKYAFEKNVRVNILHGETKELLHTFSLYLKPAKFYWLKLASIIGIALILVFGFIYYIFNSKS